MADVAMADVAMADIAMADVAMEYCRGEIHSMAFAVAFGLCSAALRFMIAS